MRQRRPLIGVTLILLLCITTHALGKGLSIREWTNDTKVFDSQVLNPLTEQFKDKTCEPETDIYIGAALEQLKGIRSLVTAKAYVLFREAILITAEDLAPFEAELNCSVIDRWQLMRAHIKNKLEFIGNVFSIIE